MYSSGCNVRNSNDSKLSLSESQEKSLTMVKNDSDCPLGKRLRGLFDGATNAEIARLLELTDATLSNYMTGKKTPDTKPFVKILELTNVNPRWLLTGEGEKGDVFEAPKIQKVVLSKGEELLKENSLPNVVTQFLDTFEEIKSRLAALENKKETLVEQENDNAQVNTITARQGFAVTKPRQTHPEMDYRQIREYLEKETGKEIPIAAIILYEDYMITGKQDFFEQTYPTDIQEIVAAFFAGTFEQYLSEQRQRLAE